MAKRLTNNTVAHPIRVADNLGQGVHESPETVRAVAVHHKLRID
jgi:hypothetical protein